MYGWCKILTDKQTDRVALPLFSAHSRKSNILISKSNHLQAQ